MMKNDVSEAISPIRQTYVFLFLCGHIYDISERPQMIKDNSLVCVVYTPRMYTSRLSSLLLAKHETESVFSHSLLLALSFLAEKMSRIELGRQKHRPFSAF
jgi:hypothetical protein